MNAFIDDKLKGWMNKDTVTNAYKDHGIID